MSDKLLQEFLNSDIRRVSRIARKTCTGDLFGIELECEGIRVDYEQLLYGKYLSDGWEAHDDGSLRNNHGSSCEWVFKGPASYEDSVKRVDDLFKYFDVRKAKLITSNRTSTHVHFNMGDKAAYQLVNMFILFTILEDLLDTYCGDDRKGNLFCLSSRHAEQQIDWFQKACLKEYFLNFNGNNRYCSFNIASINKFGTVEFRGMRGLDNKQDVLSWLGIIREFCDYACYKMKNPINLVEQISVKRPIGFLKEIFSDNNVLLLTNGLDEEAVDRSVFEGLRLVQMMCYKIGAEFDGVRIRSKDFWADLAQKNKKKQQGGDGDPMINDFEAFVGNVAAPPPLRGFAQIDDNPFMNRARAPNPNRFFPVLNMGVPPLAQEDAQPFVQEEEDVNDDF